MARSHSGRILRRKFRTYHWVNRGQPSLSEAGCDLVTSRVRTAPTCNGDDDSAVQNCVTCDLAFPPGSRHDAQRREFPFSDVSRGMWVG